MLQRHIEHIGQDQPPFGIGVEDLDRLAAAGSQHVAQLIGVAAKHVFHQPREADHIHRQLQQGDGLHRAEHGCGACHVAFHGLHAVGRLNREAAGVERDAFADEGERRGIRRPTVVFEDDQSRLAV